MSDQLKLFSDFELPISVRPHRILNFEQSKWTRAAAKLAALRRVSAAVGICLKTSDVNVPCQSGPA
jgi:hypothetical protein